MSRRSTALSLIVVGALISAGCQSDLPTQAPSATSSAEASAPPTPSPEPTPLVDVTATGYAPEAGVDGGTVIIGDWREAKQFHPYYLGQGAEPAVASALWAGLVRLTRDLRYQADLAAEIPTVYNGGVTLGEGGSDAMTVRWTLRPGLVWSDGQPLTCDDFEYAWEWALDEDNFGVRTTGLDAITEIECESATAMTWHFDAIRERYLTILPTPLPRHYLEPIPIGEQVNGAGFRLDELARVPTSGPFRIASVAPGVEVVLARNPGHTAAARGTPAYLESVVFRWFANVDALVAAFKAGSVDVATGLTDVDVATLADLGAQVVIGSSATYETLRPNWSEETCSPSRAMRERGDLCPTSDVDFRLAIASAVDRAAVQVQALGSTGAIPTTNVLPGAWFTATRPAPTFDPAAARRILEDAGWVDDDGDGVREKDGTTAEIEICSIGRQKRLDTVALLIDWLRDVGIRAVLTEAQPDDMFAAYQQATSRTPCALSRGNFDLAIQSLSTSIHPGDFYARYHSSQIEPDGANDASVNDPGIDIALDTVRTAVHPAVISDAMAEFQIVYADRGTEMPLYFVPTVELVAADIGNALGSPPSGPPTWNIADWFVRR